MPVQYTVTVPGFDLGFYVGYYLGHDYYNIWFDRVVHAFQLGISGRVGPVLFQDRLEARFGRRRVVSVALGRRTRC